MFILERRVRQQHRQWATIHAPPYVAHDPVAQRYQALFELLDWSRVPEIDETQRRAGHLPHPEAAYIKAYVVMVNEKLD